MGLIGAEPLPGDEAEEHGAERGDETEGEIAAAVVEEWFFAREKIHEPLVEASAEVPIFIPVRGEAGEVLPIGRDADGLPIEIRGRERIECPGGPVANEDGGESDPLSARACEGEEEREGVAEADLSEGIFEGEIGHGAIDAAEENSEEDQEERTPDGVSEHFWEGVTFGDAAGDGEWERDTDHKGEGGLDEVVERATDPFDVRLLVGQERPELAFGKIASDAAEMEDFGDHEEHDEAAVGIERDETLRGGSDDGFRIDLFGWRGGSGGSGSSGGVHRHVGWGRFSRSGGNDQCQSTNDQR